MGLVILAQYELLVLRKQQLVEADRWTSELYDNVAKAEAKAESTWDRIDNLCDSHGLGNHGTPLEKLDRISALLQLRHERIDELDSVAQECHGEIKELRAKLEEERTEHSATQATFADFREANPDAREP